MLDRDACERRVYRLATLLTGDPRAAAGVIGRVLDAQPDLSRLDGAHMDRLTVLRSREIPPRALRSQSVPDAVSEALAELRPQQREAWVFSRVYQMSGRELARAMDCSITAANLHLNAADESMHRSLGGEESAAAGTLLDYSMSLEVPAFYHAQRSRRKRLRKSVILAIIVLAILLVMAVVAWLGRPRSPSPSENSTSTSTTRATSP